MITGTLALVLVFAAAGLALVFFNGRKLIRDWPLPKPRHNVDLAWIQVYVGLAALVVAWFLATDPARKLIDPTPEQVSGESMSRPSSSSTHSSP